MSASHTTFLDMSKFHVPKPVTSGGAIAIFTDPGTQMLCNEIKKYLLSLLDSENWLFLITLVKLEKSYQQLQEASEQKSIETQQQIFDMNLDAILTEFIADKAKYDVNISGETRSHLISAITSRNQSTIAKGLIAAGRQVVDHINQCIWVKSPSNQDATQLEIQRLTVIKASSSLLDAKAIIKKVDSFKERIDILSKLTNPTELIFTRKVLASAKAQLEKTQQAPTKFNCRLYNPHVIPLQNARVSLDTLQAEIASLLQIQEIEFNEFQEKLNVILAKAIQHLTVEYLNIDSNEKPTIHHISSQIKNMIDWLTKIKYDSYEEKIATRLAEEKALEDIEKMQERGQYYHYRQRSVSSPQIFANVLKTSTTIPEENSPTSPQPIKKFTP